MTVNKIQNVAQIISDSEIVESNTVDTVVQIPLTVIQTVDKTEAFIGDILSYSITMRNDSLLPKINVAFTNTIPNGTCYVQDSFHINGVKQTPLMKGDTLYFSLPSIDPLRSVVVSFQVEVVV